MVMAAGFGPPLSFCAGFRRTLPRMNVRYLLITAGALLSLSDDGLASERTLTVKATAYNSTPAQTVGDPTRAAWGDELRPGMRVIAVSPDLLELGLTRGTEVRIDGVEGTWIVLDRTHSRHRKRIDLYMGNDVKAARRWGIRTVTIRWTPGEASSAEQSASN